jgi:thioredoxin-like negative regulator of GroEL
MNRQLKPIVTSSSSLLALAALLLAGCFQPSPEQQLSKARDYLERRENVAAVLELKALLDKQPSLAPARAMLARSLLETGDVAGAEVELKRAKDLGLPVEQLAATEARLLLQQGALQKLITEHGGRRLKDPTDDVDLRVSVAAARLVSGQQAEVWH